MQLSIHDLAVRALSQVADLIVEAYEPAYPLQMPHGGLRELMLVTRPHGTSIPGICEAQAIRINMEVTPEGASQIERAPNMLKFMIDAPVVADHLDIENRYKVTSAYGQSIAGDSAWEANLLQCKKSSDSGWVVATSEEQVDFAIRLVGDIKKESNAGTLPFTFACVKEGAPCNRPRDDLQKTITVPYKRIESGPIIVSSTGEHALMTLWGDLPGNREEWSIKIEADNNKLSTVRLSFYYPPVV